MSKNPHNSDPRDVLASVTLTKGCRVYIGDRLCYDVGVDGEMLTVKRPEVEGAPLLDWLKSASGEQAPTNKA